MKPAFIFKVTTKGVIINLNTNAKYDRLKNELKEHVNEASDFFAGVDIYINLNGWCFESTQIDEIFRIVSNYKKVNKIYLQDRQVESGNNARKSDTLLIHRTIRSGQRIKYPTNVVIVGDVNPGGEIIAGGNIVVLGKLRGVVHAGAGGEVESEVIAFRLEPTQIRIASYISRSPDQREDRNNSFKPEKAFVKDNVIIIEELDI